jgi:hypothetical protein
MLVVYTPALLTPLSFEAAAESLTEAIRQKIGREPSLETRALALGKSALETARWRSMYCSSYGNIRPNETQSGQYQCLPICNEIDAKGVAHWYTPEGEVKGRSNLTVVGKVWPVPPGCPSSRFLAYANRWDGAFEYIDFMSRPSYAAVWERMVAGDAAGMVHQMKLKRYFTASEASYSIGVVSLQREFIDRLKGLPPKEVFDPPDREWQNLRAEIVGSSWSRLQDELFAPKPKPDDDV